MLAKICKKACAAAARLAAALVLFGGSLLGGEALLAAAGGGNVAHATASNFRVDWNYSPATVRFYWDGAPDNNRYGLAVYRGRCGNAGPGNCLSQSANRIHNSGDGGSGETNNTGQNATRQELINKSLFTPGQEYSFHFRQGSTGSPSTHYFTQPQPPGAAVSINTAYGDSNDFDVASLTLTWEKDSNDVIGWDVEVREGACSGQTCTAPLVTSLTAAAAARTVSFPGVSFSRGLQYSFRIRGKKSDTTGDWANHSFSVALGGGTPTFTMGWSADTGGTVTTFGGTLRWNFAALHNLAALAVYQGRCSGAECVTSNLIYDSGGGHAGTPFAPPAGDRRQVFAATTFARGTEYTFKFAQGGVGSVVETLSYFRAPGTPPAGEAVTAAVSFGGNGVFEQTANLTWEKNHNDVTAWEIEVRDGTCAAANCDSSALVTSFTAAATATSRAFGSIFIRGVQYTFRIRGVNGSETSGWHNNNQGLRATPANLSGAISQFKMYWARNPNDPNKFGGVLRWNGAPQNSKWGLAVYVGRCTSGGACGMLTPISNIGNAHGGFAGQSDDSRSQSYTNTIFAAGQEYTFRMRQGNGANDITPFRQFTAPGGVGSAVSVGVSFGPQVSGNVNANLTWGRTTVALSHWDVEVRQGQCSANDCSASLVTSFANLPASARSQSFDALFVRGTEYSFRIRGRSGSDVGSWHNANMGLRATPATLATPETPVLSRMDDGLRLYLVQSSVNSAYVAAFDDGAGEARFTTYQPANVTAGGIFNVGNIQIDRYAFHDVLVTIWGAHADGFASTLSGASIIVTAYNSYAKPAPTPMPPGAVRNESAAAGSPGYAGVTISWDPPANIDGVNIARYEVSYGGTVTVSARQSGSHGVSLFSNLFGLASDYSKTIPVTLRAVSDAGVYGPPVVVTPSNSSGNIDSWKGSAPDTDNIPRIVRVEPFLKNPPSDDQILFRVFVDVDRAYKMENFRFDGFQGAGLQSDENTDVEGGFGSYQLLDAFNQIIMVTVDTVDEGEINASAFPSGTYSIRIRSFNGVWGTHGTPPPEQFSPWYEFSYNVDHFTTGDLSALNAESGDGQLVVNGTYSRPIDVDDRVLPYQYIHPVGGNTIDAQGAGGFRSVIDGLINGVAYTVSARLGENSWQTAVGTPYAADAPQIVAFLGDDARVLGTVTNTHSNVVTLRWRVNYDGATDRRVELRHAGATQTVAHEYLGSYYYYHSVVVAKNREHVFTIRAHSNRGSSGFATATVFLPQSLPGRAATAYASPARGGFTVFWTTPADTGGAPISHYSVVALPIVNSLGVTTANNIVVNASVAEAAGVKSHVVVGAPLGVRQCLVIRAYNTAFSTVAGPAALACAAPGDTPIKPVLNPIFVGGGGGVTISLYPGQTITVSSGDYHRYFDPSNPDVGYNPFSSYDGNTVELFWNRSNDLQHQASLLGGAPATEVEYLLSYADANGMTRNKTILGRGGATLNSADGIKYGTPYVFTLRAQNSFGASPVNVFSLTTYQWAALAPSPPRSFVAERTDSANMVRVRWGLPIGNNFGGRPSDKTHADLTYRIIYYPLKDGTQQVSQVTIDGVSRNVTTTVYPLANYATLHITTAMAMQAEIPISVSTVDWRFYIQSFNSAEITLEVVNTPPSYIGAAGSWPLKEAVYDYYADEAEASRGLKMRNVAVGVSDLSQDPAVVRQGFTISWSEPQNADGDGWPAGIPPGGNPESTTLSRWIRVIILAQTEPGNPPTLTYAHHDIQQTRGAGGGWGVEYASGSALSVFQTCAAGCRNANNTGANLNLAFDYSRKYRFTLVPYVRNNIAGVNYWGKATVVQVAPYIHPTTINAGMPYNVRAEGGSITWRPLGIGTGHGNISLSHYELTEITGGTITAAPLSPGNPRKQLVFIPFEEANAGKHSVGVTPQSNKGVFRHSQLTTPIALRTFRYEETQMVNGEEVVVTSTLLNRSRYYRVQTFFKSHVGGHVFAAENGVVTVTFVPPLPLAEAAPAAPVSLLAELDLAERKVAVSWIRPDDKGRRILEYALLYNGFAARVSGHLQAYTLAMRAGASHTVQLVARSGVGVGAAAVAVAHSPARAPEPPVIFAFTPGNGKISLRWQAPESDGGAAITGYIATVFGGAAAVAGDGDARSYTFTGLTNGQLYTLGIYAGNGQTLSDGGIALVTAAPHPTRPGEPANFAVTANGHARLSVSWQTPSDTGGDAISRYLVYVDGFVAATVASSGTNAQLTGIAFGASGIDYNVAVAAQNIRGVGARAATVATAMGTPDVPKNLVVVGGADKAIFYWDPANNAGSEVLGYSITYADSGGEDTAVSIAPVNGEASHTITALGNGVYTYTMFAFNAIGNGESVFAANVTSQAGPPLRPASVTVVPGVDQIAVTWGETDANGPDITAFVLYNGASVVHTLTDVALRTYTFTDLTTRGQTYTLGVAAQNNQGIGIRRDFIAVPLAVPGAPANFVATPGFRQIALTWGAANGYGSPLNAYLLNGDVLNVDVTASAFTLTISNLTTGTRYDYTLQARNSIGAGSEAVAFATPVPRAPSVPQNVEAESLLNSVRLSWEAVADNGDDAAIDYEVYVNDAENPAAENVTVMTYFFASLSVGSTATVGVAARNSAGKSPAVFATVTVFGAPDAPQVVVAPANGRAILYLTAPTDTGGLPLTGYDIAYGVSGGAQTSVSRGAVDAVTLESLTNDTEYTFVVNAKNRLGGGNAVTATATPQSGAPLRPQNFRAAITDTAGEIRITWGDTDNNGSAITAYFVYLNGVTVTNISNLTVRAYTFSALNRGEDYTVGVAAANGSSVNEGLGIRAQTIASPLGKPGAPASAAISAEYPTVSITWEEGQTYNGAILRYVVVNGGVETTLGATVRSYQHSVSAIGSQFYTLYAANAAGDGDRLTLDVNVVAIAPKAPNLAPPQPAASEGDIDIAWTAPANDGGAAITGYVIYVNGVAAQSVAANVTSYLLTADETGTSLEYGETYSIEVAARNSAGEGDKAFELGSLLSAPGAPRNFAATPGFRHIVLTWSAASRNGADIDAYFLNGTLIQNLDVTADSFTLTMDGLTTGTEYAFTAYARNSQGLGAEAFVTATPPANPPSVPQNLMVESILNSISLSWSAVANTGDDANITYDLYANNILTPVAQNVTAMTQLFTVGMHGLTVGSTSTVGVAARNSGGSSSVALIAVTVFGAPAAPQVTIAEANGRVILYLTAPTNTGGLPLTDYVLVYGIAAEEARTTVTQAVATEIIVGGLTNDTEYTFVVVAKNRLGGSDSVTTNATPQSGAPLRPADFRAATTDMTAEIRITWGETDANGSPIEGFIVYLDNAPAMTLNDANARAHTFSGLTRGQDYSVGVAATNGSTMNAGVGVRAQTVASPLGAPGEPLSVSISAEFPTVSITWEEGETYNGTILRYVVNGATLNASARSYKDSAATVGMNVYTLYAVNVGGNGDPVTVDINVAAIAPKAPTLARPQPSETDGGIDIAWTAPANDGGADIDAYIIYVNGSAVHTTAADATAYLLTMDEAEATLEYGETYQIEVAARNSVGEGDKAADVGSLLSKPGLPQSIMVTVGDGRIGIGWSAANANGATITNYVITRTGPTRGSPQNLGTMQLSYTDSGLINGEDYFYELYAANSVGMGATATVSVSPGRGPGAPGGFRVSPVDENGVATVMWTAPGDTGGRSISGYNFRYIIASLAATGTWQTDSANAGETVKVFSSLEASVVYRFSLQAINSLGAGAWVGAQSGGNQAAELDKAILPVAAAALSRQWSQAINQRLSQVGAVGGGGLQANALGASFGEGQMERGVAELLRKHGGALANGQKLDGSALRNMTFSLGGGAGAGAGATGGAGGGMGAGYSQLLNGGGIWGGASYTNMENKKGETPWEGDNIAYYAGIDRAMDAERRLLAGVMFAHNRLETSYTKSSDNSRGEYNLRATGAHPYLLWRSPDNASRFWATFGYGAGEVEFAEANQAKSARDAKIYSASGGFRRNLWSNSNGAELDGQADFAIANIEVDNPGEANSEADAKNFRALLEARNHFKTINGGVASPFMRAGFRHQSDDIDSKSGWEFAAGWRWNAKGGGWNGEVSGGAAGLSGGYKEWSANAMLRKNDTGGKGLWLTLRPQYGVNGGNPVAASGDLWRAMTSTNADANERAASLSLDVGYGLFGASALWRPFVGATVGDNAGEYRAGAKWESRLRADMGMSAGVAAKRKPAADEMQVNFAVTY